MRGTRRIAAMVGFAASLLVAFWAGRFWLKPFMIYGHSAFVDYLRLYCFDRAVRGGVLYPRWIDEFYYGYGSPIFNFYAPLFYIYSEVFSLFGASVLYALKIARLLLFLMAGCGMYLFARTYVDEFVAWVAGALYVLSNYFLVNAYVRVASAELLALALAPYLLWTLVRFFRKPSGRRLVAAAFVFALVVLSHNISGLLWAACVAGFGLWTAVWTRSVKRLRQAFVVFALGLSFSAFFWLPAFYERDLVHSEESLTQGYFDYRKHFVYPDQIWTDRWGYGTSREGRADTMPVSCGRIVFLAWLAGLGALFVLGYSGADENREGWFFAFASVASLFMVLPFSKPVWVVVPLIKYVQFPWRFYLLFTPLAVATFVAGAGLIARREKYLAVVLAAIVVFGVLVWQVPRARGYRLMLDTRAFKPLKLEPDEVLLPDGAVDPHRYFTVERILAHGVTTTAKDDYLPIWVSRRPTSPPSDVLEVVGGAKATLLERGYNRLKVQVDSDSRGSVLVLNLFYFPGWKAVRSGGELPVGHEEGTGRLVVSLEEGVYELEVYFDSDAVRRIGWALSICAFVAAAVVFVASSVRGRKREGE